MIKDTMEIKDTLKLSEEFSDSAGARDYKDGKHSGQQFYDTLLEKRFQQAVQGNYILLVDLDDFWGWPSSFVSASFGQLSIKFGKDLVLSHLNLKCNSNPMKVTKTIHRINNPIKK